jgi:hypothetical protein
MGVRLRLGQGAMSMRLHRWSIRRAAVIIKPRTEREGEGGNKIHIFRLDVADAGDQCDQHPDQAVAGTASRTAQRATKQYQSNLRLYRERAEDAGIDKVIAALQVGCYEAASKDGFDFNVLHRGRLAPRLLKDLPQFKTYGGFSTEQLFDKLYTWMHRLKIIARDYPDSPKFRKRVRLINIWKLMLLLVKHINS